MLTIFGPSSRRHCDGVSRRNFLRIGAVGALTLADVFRAESRAGTRSAHKAVIHIYLAGGPPHQDMWDIKTEAPAEIRGEFRPIATRVPGLHIGEVFPKIAAIMDRCAVVRSIVGAIGQRDAYQCMTGSPGIFLPGAAVASSGRPSAGSVVSRLQGPVDPSVPPYVWLEGPHKALANDPRRNAFNASFVGPAHAPFDPDGPIMADMRRDHLTPQHITDRRGLLNRFDTLRREADARGAMASMDAATQRAFDVLTSSKVLDALDLNQEPVRVRERYGRNQSHSPFGQPFWSVNENFLQARRANSACHIAAPTCSSSTRQATSSSICALRPRTSFRAIGTFASAASSPPARRSIKAFAAKSRRSLASTLSRSGCFRSSTRMRRPSHMAWRIVSCTMGHFACRSMRLCAASSCLSRKCSSASAAIRSVHVA